MRNLTASFAAASFATILVGIIKYLKFGHDAFISSLLLLAGYFVLILALITVGTFVLERFGKR